LTNFFSSPCDFRSLSNIFAPHIKDHRHEPQFTEAKVFLLSALVGSADSKINFKLSPIFTAHLCRSRGCQVFQGLQHAALTQADIDPNQSCAGEIREFRRSAALR
jgi:hypothetical protein